MRQADRRSQALARVNSRSGPHLAFRVGKPHESARIDGVTRVRVGELGAVLPAARMATRVKERDDIRASFDERDDKVR